MQLDQAYLLDIMKAARSHLYGFHQKLYPSQNFEQVDSPAS
jgi:hypothetical protein